MSAAALAVSPDSQVSIIGSSFSSTIRVTWPIVSERSCLDSVSDEARYQFRGPIAAHLRLIELEPDACSPVSLNAPPIGKPLNQEQSPAAGVIRFSPWTLACEALAEVCDLDPQSDIAYPNRDLDCVINAAVNDAIRYELADEQARRLEHLCVYPPYCGRGDGPTSLRHSFWQAGDLECRRRSHHLV